MIVKEFSAKRAEEMSLLPSSKPGEVTQLLLDWSHGDELALQKLIPIVYGELQRMAHHYMSRERPGHTLQTTALVNEAYERLIDTRRSRWQDRNHFFAVCAQIMRRILVDHARSHQYLKRGGGAQRVALDEGLEAYTDRNTDLVAIDGALTALAEVDARKAHVVELRFFGGLTVEETADVLKISPDTVMRDWKMAKVWLLRELSEGKVSGS
jgi:RNA polymerase sigma factor (TIGR02999 family)